MSKYHARPTIVDGFRFDSRAEAERFLQLRDMVREGAISDLAVHPRYPLTVNGERVAYYEADFRYKDEAGRVIVEDVKSPVTRKLPAYRLKAKLMHAVHGIEVQEIAA